MTVPDAMMMMAAELVKRVVEGEREDLRPGDNAAQRVERPL